MSKTSRGSIHCDFQKISVQQYRCSNMLTTWECLERVGSIKWDVRLELLETVIWQCARLIKEDCHCQWLLEGPARRSRLRRLGLKFTEPQDLNKRQSSGGRSPGLNGVGMGSGTISEGNKETYNNNRRACHVLKILELGRRVDGPASPRLETSPMIIDMI